MLTYKGSCCGYGQGRFVKLRLMYKMACIEGAYQIRYKRQFSLHCTTYQCKIGVGKDVEETRGTTTLPV